MGVSPYMYVAAEAYTFGVSVISDQLHFKKMWVCGRRAEPFSLKTSVRVYNLSQISILYDF